ncbi:hypothetical protein C1645_743899 [Glomus cerebriforme]|uniref:Uncharacterized protein n=1 Tax=Glomus cerebriforme TaxID=658196 RepID=A0A397S7D8_9GLOM|nr:hypothetical protein C1645_743899 [Glomus cerebriforme]
MKIILSPLKEDETIDCNYFTPNFYFETEWCLDLHGYLNRKQLKARLVEINEIVMENPLLSKRAKKGLLYAFVGIFMFLIILIIVLAFYDSVASISISVVEVILSIVTYIGNRLIDEAAKRRSDIFTKALNEKFKIFNLSDNPIANWKLVWTNVLTHYKIEMKYDITTGRMQGKSTPKYAEQAEIVLEINDSLSSITKNDVRIKIDELGFYIPRKIGDIDPDEKDTSSLIPSSRRMSNSQEMRIPSYDERISYDNRASTSNSQRMSPYDDRLPQIPTDKRMPSLPNSQVSFDKRMPPLPNSQLPYDENILTDERISMPNNNDSSIPYNQMGPNYYMEQNDHY